MHLLYTNASPKPLKTFKLQNYNIPVDRFHNDKSLTEKL